MAVAMIELAGQKCEACRRGAPPATEAEIAEFGRQIPEWEIVDRGGIPTLERVFRFGDFVGGDGVYQSGGGDRRGGGTSSRAVDGVGAG